MQLCRTGPVHSSVAWLFLITISVYDTILVVAMLKVQKGFTGLSNGYHNNFNKGIFMQACSGSTPLLSTALVSYDSTLPHILVRTYLNSDSARAHSTALVPYDATLPHISVREYLNIVAYAVFKNTERNPFSQSREYRVSNIDTVSWPLLLPCKTANGKYTLIEFQIHCKDTIDRSQSHYYPKDERQMKPRLYRMNPQLG